MNLEPCKDLRVLGILSYFRVLHLILVSSRFRVLIFEYRVFSHISPFLGFEIFWTYFCLFKASLLILIYEATCPMFKYWRVFIIVFIKDLLKALCRGLPFSLTDTPLKTAACKEATWVLAKCLLLCSYPKYLIIDTKKWSLRNENNTTT